MRISENETTILDFGYDDTVLLYLLVERASRDAKPLRCALHVPALLVKDPVDVRSLELQQSETIPVACGL